MLNENRQKFLLKLDQLEQRYKQSEMFQAIRELFNTLFPEVFESGTLSGKALFEIAMKKEKYFSTAFSQFINIRSNCAYFLLFDDTSNYQLPTG